MPIYNRAILYGDQHKYDLARADLRQVNRLTPAFAAAYGSLGWYLILQGRFDEAREPTQKAHELAPKRMAWTVNLGHIYLLEGDGATAREYYQKALPLIISEEELVSGPVADFDLFIEQGWQVEECRRELAWMRQEFEQTDAWRLKADRYGEEALALFDQGQYLAAAQQFAQAAETEKASVIPRLVGLSAKLAWAGYCYNLVGRYAEALDYYQQVLALDRELGGEADIATDLNNIGEVYRAWGRYAEALDHYQQALALDQKLGREADIALRLNNIGAVYSSWGRYEAALDHYQQALAIARKLGSEVVIAVALNNIGAVYKSWGRYEAALDHFQQALAINQKLGHEADIAVALNNIGLVYDSWGRYAEALDYYQQALVIDQELGNETGIATALNNIGEVYDSWGRYVEALDHYQQALVIDQELGNEAGIATALNNIGFVYESWGRYAEALDHYQQALALDQRLGREADIANRLSNIGAVYSSWGRYEVALDHYQQALAIDQELGNEAGIATAINNIGFVYDSWGRYKEALDYYQQALALDQKLGREAQIATVLNNIGAVYESWGRYAEALDHYQQALALHQKLGREANIATGLNNIGFVYKSLGRYAEALDYYQQALALDQRLGREADIALRLNNIGTANMELKNYPAAIDFFEKSVEIKEKLRTTATGTVRRDYLASQIHTYQWLVSTYVRQGDPANVFRLIELSRAKLLAEQLAGDESKVSLPSVEQIQRALPDETAILTYANADRSDKVLMAITSDRLYAMERADRVFVDSTLAQYGTAIQTLHQNQQALARNASTEKRVGAVEKQRDFDQIITYYRHLLTDPSLSGERGAHIAGRLKEGGGAPVLDDLSRRLYEFLVQPLADRLQDKQELLIVPDGILGFLPFETLKDEDGRYLVERFSIRYAQSLSVLDQIQQRSYPTDRKPLLAFGGAIYEESTYSREPVRSQQQLAAITKSVYADLEQNRSARSAYGALGIGQWTNLPGTLDEVREIAGLVADADTIIGADVAEARVKSLARDGILAQYKVLHFATHGLVVPALPELSALVLSQFNEEREEDGYLRMGEIVELGLQADLVNLSACETGLGKIYGGEGVVGLPQAFLLAGANGLSVSLWSVADRSTAQFMGALYGAVEEEGVGYAAVIAEIKRQFIAGEFGEQYRVPYYWAPFVYYGK